MTLSKAWREAHKTYFPDLPLDCGNDLRPGVVYSEDLRDWSDKATTPDQRRMELYLDRFDLRGKRILHVGMGDSGLAARFHRRAKEIVGTTIDDPEMQVAKSRGLPNYRFVIQNKFLPANEAIEGKFDFILDNNPSSPCCCVRHFSDMFDLYLSKLAPGGQIVTDREGLEWVPSVTNPRWAFTFDDLKSAAAAAGLSTYRVNGTVYVMSHQPPPQPGPLPLARHFGRRLLAMPGQIARHGPHLANIYTRRIAKAVLGATVPWALPQRHRPVSRQKP